MCTRGFGRVDVGHLVKAWIQWVFTRLFLCFCRAAFLVVVEGPADSEVVVWSCVAGFLWNGLSGAVDCL